MMEKIKQHGLIIFLVVILSFSSGLLLVQARNQPAELMADATPGFSFQGVLEDTNVPYTGTCDMQFNLWDAANGGAKFGATQTINDVQVNKGLFTVQLNEGGQFGPDAFNGGARWLEISVRCGPSETDFTVLTPRQPVSAVPLALSLRPGAAIFAETGTALTIESLSSTNASLLVNGQGSTASAPSLRVNNAASSGYGIYVNKTIGAGVGLQASNNGATGSGVAGYSADWYGVYGYTGRSDDNYGLYTPDNLYSKNVTTSGSMMMVVQNDSDQPLEMGDVAAFAGISDANRSGQPIIQVTQVTEANASAVAGVVYGGFPAELLNAPPEGFDNMLLNNFDRSAPVSRGGYLLLVVYGPAQVKNSAAVGSIQPGNLLSVSGTDSGGIVFGKALESAGPEKAFIYVFVTLQ
jgi:hypothetical protein